jgi:hypothetical protein
MATDRDVVTYVGASNRSGGYATLFHPSIAAAGITEPPVPHGAPQGADAVQHREAPDRCLPDDKLSFRHSSVCRTEARKGWSNAVS